MQLGKKLVFCTVAVLPLVVLCSTISYAQGGDVFTVRLQSIMSRPEYRHSSFGIEILSLTTDRPVFTLHGDKLFTPGSTTKLLTEGAALELLGAGYRFHTNIYKMGKISASGVLTGDLILVATGDPNLSNRIQPDGTLAFENEDHSYGGSRNTRAVPGDPLAVIQDLVRQIAAAGIKDVRGRILVDVSLFPEGERELGTGVVISPICLNDNLIDVTISPGTKNGGAALLSASPGTGYVRIINKVTTTPAGSALRLDDPMESRNPDGSYVVSFTGSLPLAGGPVLVSYPVAQPSRFTEFVLAEALRKHGIKALPPRVNEKVEFGPAAKEYIPNNIIATHISPPLSQEVKVTLKVSQNLHASMMPFLLGALLAKGQSPIEQAGFDRERDFLQKANLDLTGASQSDGAGGAEAAFFTPDFIVRYLAYMSTVKDFSIFKQALPVLGRDGTLFNIQTNSPAAGHVFAKTGTFNAVDKLNRRLMLTGKGLAGYTTTPGGEPLAFALYINRVSLPLDDPEAITNTAGQALGEIAAAAHLCRIDQAALPGASNQP